jgi:hypothetical protein
VTVSQPPSAEVDLPSEDSSKNNAAQGAVDPFAASLVKLQFLLSLLQIFVVSLTIRLCFNFATAHPNFAFVGDANEYLREATALAAPVLHTPDFLQHAIAVLLGKATTGVLEQVHSQTAVLDEFKMSGPVFPLFLLTCFSLGGQGIGMEHWQVPVIIQSLISSFTCVLIALTARRVWNRTVGVTAGALAAIYPSFILATGSFYTETFTTFLYSLIAFISVTSILYKPIGNIACVFLGFLSAALQLTRPPATVLSLITFPFLLWQRRNHKPLIALSMLLIGFALICAPYVAFQKVAFNTCSLIVNRRPSENLVTGNSNQTQGWSATPFIWMPPESERTAYVVKHALASPRQFAQLLVDKFIRLTKFPFNDFRISIGPITFPKQVLFHELLMLFAAIGIALTLFTVPTRDPEVIKTRPVVRRLMQAKLYLLMMLGTNLVYVAFIAMARYFLPTMPIVIMFAAAGVVSLATCLKHKSYPLILSTAVALIAVLLSAQINFSPLLLKTGILSNILLAQTADFTIRLIPVFCLACIVAILIRSTTRGYQRAAYACTCVLLLLLIPVVCLPSRANGRSLETTFVLNRPGQTLKQEILLPPSVGPAYLMLDLEGVRSLNGLSVTVNGVELPPRFIPSLAVIATSPTNRHLRGHSFYLEGENLFHCMALPSRISNADLRQWFLLPLPEKLTGAGAGAANQTIDAPTKVQIELKKTNFATTIVYGEFARNKDDLMIPSISLQSDEKAFLCVESPLRFGDPRFDTRVKLLVSPSAVPLTSTDAIPNIRLLTTPEANPISHEESHVALADQQIESSQQTIVSITPRFEPNAKVQLLRFHGSIKTLRGSPAPHIALQAFSNAGDVIAGYDSPWTPSQVLSADNWQPFSFTVPLSVSELPGKVQSLNLLISDGDPEQLMLRKPHVQTTFALKNFSMEVSPLTSRPLEPGFVIY